MTLESLKIRDIELKNLLGHKIEKRGLFNAVGTIFKTLIGTLDSNDAQFYDDSINKINANELELTHLLKSQIQVVQSTIQNFNKTISSVDKNRRTLIKNLDLLKAYAENNNVDIENLNLISRMEQHIQLLQIMISQSENEISTLINAILFIKQGSLHPSIISSSQLVKELSKTLHFLPSNVNYPSNLDESHIHEILNIVTLQAYFTNTKLICIINIPLVDDTEFNLYHLIPLPVSYENQNHVFIQPSSTYLAISKNKLHYTLMQEIINCKSLSETSYICENTEPMFSTHTKPICETELLFFEEHIPQSCDKRIVQLSSEIWHKLDNKNQWVFVLPKTNIITISCQNKETFKDISVSGSGILELKPKCKAYTPSTILLANTVYTSNYTSILPKFDIVNDCEEIQNANFSELKLQTISNTKFNLDSLDVASHKLDTISKLADEMLSRHKLQKHVSVLTYILYGVGVLIILFIMYWLYHKCQRIILKKNDHNVQETTCGRFINCLTFNIGNRDIRHATAPSQEELESHRETHKPLVYSNLLDKETQNNESNEPYQIQTRSSTRRYSIKNKY